jgi:hypothetical protein
VSGIYRFVAYFLGTVFHGMARFMSTALDGAARFVGYIASGIFRVLEGLAGIRFAGFGYHFGGAIVAHFNVRGRSGLRESSRSKSGKCEQQGYFFHGVKRKKKGYEDFVRSLQTKVGARSVPQLSRRLKTRFLTASGQ